MKNWYYSKKKQYGMEDIPPFEIHPFNEDYMDEGPMFNEIPNFNEEDLPFIPSTDEALSSIPASGEVITVDERHSGPLLSSDDDISIITDSNINDGNIGDSFGETYPEFSLFNGWARKYKGRIYTQANKYYRNITVPKDKLFRFKMSAHWQKDKSEYYCILSWIIDDPLYKWYPNSEKKHPYSPSKKKVFRYMWNGTCVLLSRPISWDFSIYDRQVSYKAYLTFMKAGRGRNWLGQATQSGLIYRGT